MSSKKSFIKVPKNKQKTAEKLPNKSKQRFIKNILQNTTLMIKDVNLLIKFHQTSLYGLMIEHRWYYEVFG